MLSFFIKRRLNAFERAYGYDVGYLREMLALSPKAVMKYLRATALGEFREGVSREAWYAASILAIVVEDSGPCAQLGVTMAERDGVDPELIRALIKGHFDALPEPVRVAACFTLATLRRAPETDALREEIIEHFGLLGLLSIAFAITTARLYPTLKYALGHGRACQRVRVGGVAMRPSSALELERDLPPAGASLEPNVASLEAVA